MKNYIRLPESVIELKPGMEVMPDPRLYNGPSYDGHKFKVLEVDKEREEALIQWSYRPARWFCFGHLFVQAPLAPKRKNNF